MNRNAAKAASKAAPKTKLNLSAILITVLVVSLIGVVVLQAVQMHRMRSPDFAADQARADAAALVREVERVMLLPDEEATVATVQDASRLRGQDFFRDTENGDRVLIFTEARRAVIWRPGENRVINSGPIVISSQAITGETE